MVDQDGRPNSAGLVGITRYSQAVESGRSIPLKDGASYTPKSILKRKSGEVPEGEPAAKRSSGKPVDADAPAPSLTEKQFAKLVQSVARAINDGSSPAATNTTDMGADDAPTDARSAAGANTAAHERKVTHNRRLFERLGLKNTVKVLP